MSNFFQPIGKLHAGYYRRVLEARDLAAFLAAASYPVPRRTVELRFPVRRSPSRAESASLGPWHISALVPDSWHGYKLSKGGPRLGRPGPSAPVRVLRYESNGLLVPWLLLAPRPWYQVLDDTPAIERWNPPAACEVCENRSACTVVCAEVEATLPSSADEPRIARGYIRFWSLYGGREEKPAPPLNRGGRYLLLTDRQRQLADALSEERSLAGAAARLGIDAESARQAAARIARRVGLRSYASDKPSIVPPRPRVTVRGENELAGVFDARPLDLTPEEREARGLPARWRLSPRRAKETSLGNRGAGIGLSGLAAPSARNRKPRAEAVAAHVRRLPLEASGPGAWRLTLDWTPPYARLLKKVGPRPVKNAGSRSYRVERGPSRPPVSLLRRPRPRPARHFLGRVRNNRCTGG